MHAYLHCLSHTPLVGFVDPEQAVLDEVNGVIADARRRIAEFDPELVVLFAPDHYNGFFYDVMPPFCLGVGATAIGDFASAAGDLLVPTELAEACAHAVINSGIDLAVSYNMQVDHGFAQPLEFLLGGLDRVPVLPVFINGVAAPLPGFQRTRLLGEGMQAEALTLCQQLERSADTLPGGLAMYHPQWHQGVVGILASRIKERFHRPVIAFAPTGDGTLKGSGRSIQGLHMRDALERLDTLYPGLILKFGGHAMAAGLSLEEARFEEFQQRFGELVTEWLDPALLQGEVVSDGPLAAAEMSMEVAQMLRDAGPWGQMFPEPLFDGRFRLLQQRLVGERHLKVMVEPVDGGPLLDGIAFNVDTSIWPDNGVREVQLAYKLDINEFRGNRSLQLIIDHLWPN